MNIFNFLNDNEKAPASRKTGRPPINNVAMTNAERQRKHRAKLKKERLGSLAKCQAVS